MKLTTDRLVIRPYEADDFEEVHVIFSDPVTMSFWPKPFDREQTRAWIDRSMQSNAAAGFGRWGVALSDSNRIIGDCGIMAATVDDTNVYDLGYIIAHGDWGRGYGLEAAEACLNYGFGVLELPELHANMPHDHTASRKVAEKLGMKRRKQFVNVRNRNILTNLYSITIGEWRQPTHTAKH